MNKKYLPSVPVMIAIFVIVFVSGYFNFFDLFGKPAPKESEQSTATVNDETAGWKTYTNTEFGFQLMFPKEWDNYRVVRHELQRSDFPDPDLPIFDKQFNEAKGTVWLSFVLKDGKQDYKAFSITVEPKAYWDKFYESQMKEDGIIAWSYLGERNGFVFSKETAQEGPFDLSLEPLLKQTYQILSTFKFTR